MRTTTLARSPLVLLAALACVACGTEVDVPRGDVDVDRDVDLDVDDAGPDEELPDEELPDEELPDEELPDEELPDEELPDEPAPEEPAPEEPAPGTSGCVAYPTIHLQASMQQFDSMAQRRQAIDKAFLNPDGVRPDTIAWTEIARQDQIDRIQNKPGWDTYWPHQPNNPDVHPQNAVPISWRTGVYELLSGASHKASDGRAGVAPNRYVTRVRLRHIPSGTTVVRVAHHSVAGVDNPQDNVAYRLAAHAQNIATFNDVMLGAGFPVIGSADFNTTRLRQKLRAENDDVQRYVFDVPASGGSHGNRLIDWIVRRKSDGNAYRLEGVRFVDLSPSDHKGVRARYAYRPPPCQ